MTDNFSIDGLFSKLGEQDLPIKEHFESQGVDRFKGKTLESLSVKELQDFLNVLEELDKKVTYGGHLNWFEEGTKYGIDKLPKHRAFFEAGNHYRIRAAIGANRCLAEGTLVATPRGPVAIEDISVGDVVYDRFGGGDSCHPSMG